MKHLNRKLLAWFFSFCALLSALAQPVSALSLSDTNGYGSYSGTGEVTTQGPVPDDLVNIQLPTVRANVLDVRLDPNNIVRLLGAEHFTVNGKTPRIGAGKVFFTNIDSSTGEVSFTRNSDRLNIVNKGNVPLTVKMSVTVDKGDNNFTFASTPNFKDESGNAISGPALYLALTTGSVRTPVLPIMEKDEVTGVETLVGYGTTSTGWIANNEGAYYLSGDPAAKRYYYARNPDFSDEEFASTTFYMTGAINNQGWDNTVNDFSLSVTWNVVQEKGPETDPNATKDVYPWADTLFAAASESDAADLYVNYGSGDKKMTTVSGLVYTAPGGAEVSMSVADAHLTVEGSYVSVPATRIMYNGSGWMLVMSGSGGICYVPFSLKETNYPLPPPNYDNDVCPAVDVTKAASAQNDIVEMTVTLGPMTRVVSMSYTMASGDENIVTNPDLLTIDGTSVSLLAFRGAWNGSAWRLNLEDDNGGTASVYFDLKNVGKVQQPVVIAQTKATAQNQTVSLKVYMNNMTEITALKYRMSSLSYNTIPHSNVMVFPDVPLPEVQIIVIRGLWNGDRPSLEFQNNAGEIFSARFEIK